MRTGSRGSRPVPRTAHRVHTSALMERVHGVCGSALCVPLLRTVKVPCGVRVTPPASSERQAFCAGWSVRCTSVPCAYLCPTHGARSEQCAPRGRRTRCGSAPCAGSGERTRRGTCRGAARRTQAASPCTCAASAARGGVRHLCHTHGRRPQAASPCTCATHMEGTRKVLDLSKLVLTLLLERRATGTRLHCVCVCAVYIVL